MTTLTSLWLCCNNFSGTIPSTISTLTGLSILDLGYQGPVKLSGTLPSTIGALTSLRYDGEYAVAGSFRCEGCFQVVGLLARLHWSLVDRLRVACWRLCPQRFVLGGQQPHGHRAVNDIVTVSAIVSPHTRLLKLARGTPVVCCAEFTTQCLEVDDNARLAARC